MFHRINATVFWERLIFTSVTDYFRCHVLRHLTANSITSSCMVYILDWIYKTQHLSMLHWIRKHLIIFSWDSTIGCTGNCHFDNFGCSYDIYFIKMIIFPFLCKIFLSFWYLCMHASKHVYICIYIYIHIDLAFTFLLWFITFYAYHNAKCISWGLNLTHPIHLNSWHEHSYNLKLIRYGDMPITWS